MTCRRDPVAVMRFAFLAMIDGRRRGLPTSLQSQPSHSTDSVSLPHSTCSQRPHSFHTIVVSGRKLTGVLPPCGHLESSSFVHRPGCKLEPAASAEDSRMAASSVAT